MKMRMNRRVNKVKEVRLKKRLTQYALAKKVGASPWRISRIERGITEIGEDEKIRIAKALGTEVKRVFSDLRVRKKWDNIVPPG